MNKILHIRPIEVTFHTEITFVSTEMRSQRGIMVLLDKCYPILARYDDPSIVDLVEPYQIGAVNFIQSIFWMSFTYFWVLFDFLENIRIYFILQVITLLYCL